MISYLGPNFLRSSSKFPTSSLKKLELDLIPPGDGRAVKQRAADASVHADVCAGATVAQEVLRAQRHFPLPRRGVP